MTISDQVGVKKCGILADVTHIGIETVLNCCPTFEYPDADPMHLSSKLITN
jgi:hypothetical protein